MTTNILTLFFRYIKNPRLYLQNLEKEKSLKVDLNKVAPLKINPDNHKISNSTPKNDTLEEPLEFSTKKHNSRVKTLILTKAWQSLQLLSIMLVVAITLVFISESVSSLVGFNQSANNLISDFLNSYPAWIAFILVVILGPLMEEAGFRLFLSKDKYSFLLGTVFFGYFIIQFGFDIFTQLTKTSTEVNIVFLTLLFLWFITIIFINFKVTSSKISILVEKYYNKLVLLSILTFGLLHITNYLNFLNYFYLIPLLVAPQLFAGTFLSFARVKFGFWWSFGLHACFNMLLSISIFIDLNNPISGTIVSFAALALLLTCIYTISGSTFENRQDI